MHKPKKDKRFGKQNLVVKGKIYVNAEQIQLAPSINSNSNSSMNQLRHVTLFFGVFRDVINGSCLYSDKACSKSK